ncbi:AraC family transcriptional regulator [Roseibium sp.]|uniref:AraC family transcriptional regulator n=1 Tax=Roseibium sp. TaxID=1936156 RepID=UPI003B51E389
MTLYRQRIQAALTYLEASIDRPLNVDQMAAQAAYSRFHVQRLFAAVTGLRVAEYHRFLRLKRAGELLAYRPDLSVTDIGLQAGYENSESFSRAFKRLLGCSPTEFRKEADWSSWQTVFETFDKTRTMFMTSALSTEEIRLIDFPETNVAELVHQGDPALLPRTVQQFIKWRRENSLPPAKSATFNILYEDPEDCDAADFRFGVCCELARPAEPNGIGVVDRTIPAGRCAVIRHKGSLDHAGDKIRSLYGVWLPQSGEDLRDFPLFVQRLTFYPDVAEQDAETDIFLPIV